jgi:thiol:disulfide interchange protein DsbC
MRILFFLLACLALALPASANESAIRAALKTRLPGVKVEGVQPAPVAGLFEVRIQSQEGPQIVYTDAAGNFLFDGNIIDLKSGRNITEERMRRLSAISFNALPLDMAVKVQRGNGKRVMAMFTDPYCPYCRRLEQMLIGIDDITVYVFMYPVIRPQNADHSRAVWCSPDRAKAWLELAALDTPRVPTASPNCANPVDKVVELGRSLRINGTPTIYLANGERVSGGMDPAELRARMDELAAAKK